MRRDALRLQDMVEAADVLAGYLRDLSQEAFLAGGLAQDAILRQLTVVGKAAFKTTDELRERHPPGALADDCRISSPSGARLLRRGPGCGVDYCHPRSSVASCCSDQDSGERFSGGGRDRVSANERGGDPVGNYPESPDSSVGTLQLKAP